MTISRHQVGKHRSDEVRDKRWRTAIGRHALSRPARLGLRDQIVSSATTLLDYGCGRGSDVKLLTAMGIDAVGWDPKFFPDAPCSPADIVNLGFVVNVIENRRERDEALRRAWALAKEVLIVSARMTWERRPPSQTSVTDGVITTVGTFQKFFGQQELKNWIESTLQTSCIPAAPGVFYVFADERSAQSFLARRFLSRSTLPQIDVSSELYKRHQASLRPLLEFYAEHGRLPVASEYQSWLDELVGLFGSVRRAFAIVHRATGPERWDLLRLERRRDLLVFAALGEFDRRPRFSDLPNDLGIDIRAILGSYKKFCDEGRKLLFAAGHAGPLGLGFEASTVGKLTPNSLYIHATALRAVPPVLRVYEGCARRLAGEIDEATVIKLRRDKAMVSYLTYREFDRDPHPALSRATIVDLRRQDVHLRYYDRSASPPILHRKDALVGPDYKLYKCFRRLTRQEERLGLLSSGEPIGTRGSWKGLLDKHQLTFRGHRLVKRSQGGSP